MFLWTQHEKDLPFQSGILMRRCIRYEFLKIFLKVYPWWMINGAAVVFYGLSLVPFAGFLLLTKGIQIFSFDLTFTVPSNLTKFGQNGRTLDKVRYVTFGSQLRSEAFAEGSLVKNCRCYPVSWFDEEYRAR